MHIATRDEKIKEYNQKYEERTTDAVERVKSYFAKRGLNLEKACKKASKKALKIIQEREYRTIHILLYEYPFQTHRPRTTTSGRMYSPNAAANKKYFEKAWNSVVSELKLITTPAEIYIDAYMEMPSTVPPDEVILFESKLLLPIDRPDYDNIEKCYTDMLTGIITSDDDLFYHAEITKYYSLLPRVDVRVTYLAKNESEYIYKKLKNRKQIKAGIESGQIELAMI